jgi:hypothetical protein
MEHTWEKYLRPKLRGVLKKWTSETGGGDGRLPSFQNYCGNERWLCWVYMLDYESNFLLCSNVDPNVNVLLENESAKPTLRRGGGNGSTNKGRSAKALAESTLKSILERQQSLKTVLEDAAQYMRVRKEAAHVPTTFVTPAKRSMTQLLADEQELKLSAERIAADELYSPNTKQKIHAAIQTSRKALINEAIRFQPTNQTPRTETTPPEGSI